MMMKGPKNRNSYLIPKDLSRECVLNKISILRNSIRLLRVNVEMNEVFLLGLSNNSTINFKRTLEEHLINKKNLKEEESRLNEYKEAYPEYFL